MRERERDFVCDVRFPFLGEIMFLEKKVEDEKPKKTNSIVTLHIYSYP